MSFHCIYLWHNARLRIWREDIIWEIGYQMRSIRGHYHRFLNATYYRLKLGFNPEDIWSLDHSFAKYILPRLKHLKKIGHGHPHSLTARQWDRELNKMIIAFSLIADENSYYNISGRRYTKQKLIDEGLDSFRKYYQSLWD